MKRKTDENKAEMVGCELAGGTPTAGQWSKLQPQTVQVLENSGVRIKYIDATTVLLEAVPVGLGFNKPRTNILFRKLRTRADIVVFVDADLEFHGPDGKTAKALSGPLRQGWRCVTARPLHGDLTGALWPVLVIVQSPLAQHVADASQTAQENADQIRRADSATLLESLGEVISPSDAEQAYNKTFRRDLAAQLAVTLCSPESPNCVLLWGRSGAGKDLLMSAAVHLLYSKGKCDCAVLVPAAAVAVGSIFPAEIDNVLTQVLTEALRQNCLLLLQDIDLCLRTTEVAKAVLCKAVDDGLRFLATVRSQNSVPDIGRDECLARRILPVEVARPSAKQLRAILERIARNSAVPVQPAAIDSVLSISARNGEAACEPAWSIGTLAAAIALAQWHETSQVDPDLVYSVLRPQWPQF